MENKLYELTRSRRSVRRYGSRRIDDEVINEIMKVALTAPTSFGHKPVEYVVVRDQRMIRKIGACIRSITVRCILTAWRYFYNSAHCILSNTNLRAA